MKKINCDVVVVGAGPGGSMAAKTCAKYGLNTVLVERKEVPSKPFAFGVLVGYNVHEYVRINEKTISGTAYKILQHFPDGTTISSHDPNGIAYVLNRQPFGFDTEVAKLAVKDGADLMLKTRATGLIRENGQIKGIKAKINEKEDIEIRSNIVIGADGVESNIGKWAGICEKLKLDEAFVVLDCMIDNVGENFEYHQYLGYENRNIDHVVYPSKDGKMSVQALSYGWHHTTKKGEFFNALKYFLKKNFPTSNIIKWGGGILAFAPPLKKYVADNVMLVGDASRQNHMPFLNGAITGMDGGSLAGMTAVEAHEEGDFSRDFLSRYEKDYYRLHGERNNLGYIIAIAPKYFPNELTNSIAHSLKMSDGVITDEVFENLAKSPKFMSKLIYEFKKQGLDIPDTLSFFSLFKKYYKNYWDLFIGC